MELFAKRDPRVNVSRPDGRPEAYMPPKGARGGVFACALCSFQGKVGIRYKWDEVVMTSPIDSDDGQAHIVCLPHTPDNLVIYDPETNKCHDKHGNEWEEK